ncbi:MAG: 1-deoxy-D-xylulose-5-phosphate synthase [Defluviitaleaceae bacterium]|nr:1-deoxy-D-xylulose-5-phosphate synthase [Defluviitaleaceae bacterium]
MRLLNTINSPEDLKRLNHTDLQILANEIRKFLVINVAKTGGHLASNLGVVELTLALHFCLKSPKDRIIWDVGHQSYIHKILTGRRTSFDKLRQLGGISGFPKTAESPHDSFDTGHSSTSISAALGMAVSRDLFGEKNRVVAVIGDGAMTSGLAFEGLNNAGRAKTDITIILNDNQQSISRNVGALSRYFNNLRSSTGYIDAKREIVRVLKSLPLAGVPAKKFIRKAKARLKYLLMAGSLFEEMGFKYYGPVDGHDLPAMIDLLDKTRHISGPVLIHINTTKGKGYPPAHAHPADFHGIAPFNPKSGKLIQTGNLTYSDVFAKYMVNTGKANDKIVAISAAMPDGTGLAPFAAAYPRRFFDVGIAESHAVTFAAGMARNGHLPIVAIYSSFLQRAYDQILHDVCITGLPVVFAIDRAGLVGGDGETHQGVFDISFLSHIPNMTILAPTTAQELEKMLDFAIGLNAPCAIRYPRETADFSLSRQDDPIRLGEYQILESGEDIAILALGSMNPIGRDVCKMLRGRGLAPARINPRFVKPLNTAAVAALAKYRHIFVLEENVYSGGFAATLRAALDALPTPPKLHNFNIPDRFLKQGTRAELLQMLNMDSSGIFDQILEILENDEA